jgi:hypothetical protein
MGTMEYPADDDARAEALFVSFVQASEPFGPDAVRTTIDEIMTRHGIGGCAALVAYEFGEHPDNAVRRMLWARQVVASFPGDLDYLPLP